MLSKFHVYLDSNIVIQAGKPPNSPVLDRVGDLVTMQSINLWTTDVTIAEVANKHAERDYKALSEVGRPHFRQLVSETFSIDLPALSKMELKQKLTDRYMSQVEKMLVTNGAQKLSVDDIAPSKILSQYAERKGFFGAEGKKDQFPDAFIFELLKPIASEETPLIIVSEDKDFEQPATDTEYISILKSLPDLFKFLGLEIEAPEIDTRLNNIHEEILEAFTAEIGNWSLLVTDILDAEIDPIKVTEVSLSDLTSFGESGGDGRILLVGSAMVTIQCWFTHPDWDNASYDSEDKVLIVHDMAEGEVEIDAHIDFSMSLLTNSNQDVLQIDELQFLDESFIYVQLEDANY